MKKITVLTLALVMFLGIALPAMAADTPEQVYAKINKAIHARDVDELMKHVSEKSKQDLEKHKEDLPKMIKLIQVMTPEEYEIVDKQISGDTATLKLTAMMNFFGMGEPKPAEGTVKMVKEEGQWKLDKEDWKQKGE
ncbi:MAG: hypothetical protein ACLFQV_04900 [Vulcanimicrobiota bacterium]